MSRPTAAAYTLHSHCIYQTFIFIFPALDSFSVLVYYLGICLFVFFFIFESFLMYSHAVIVIPQHFYTVIYLLSAPL